jgi:hypothetical protein
MAEMAMQRSAGQRERERERERKKKRKKIPPFRAELSRWKGHSSRLITRYRGED